LRGAALGRGTTSKWRRLGGDERGREFLDAFSTLQTAVNTQQGKRPELGRAAAAESDRGQRGDRVRRGGGTLGTWVCGPGSGARHRGGHVAGRQPLRRRSSVLAKYVYSLCTLLYSLSSLLGTRCDSHTPLTWQLIFGCGRRSRTGVRLHHRQRPVDIHSKPSSSDRKKGRRRKRERLHPSDAAPIRSRTLCEHATEIRFPTLEMQRLLVSSLLALSLSVGAVGAHSTSRP